MKGDSRLASSHLEIYVSFFETTVVGWNKDTYISRISFLDFQERTKNAQFIIISLRNNMFELADRLVGIYKTDNCTKSVTIDPKRLSQGIRPVQTSQA